MLSYNPTQWPPSANLPFVAMVRCDAGLEPVAGAPVRPISFGEINGLSGAPRARRGPWRLRRPASSVIRLGCLACERLRPRFGLARGHDPEAR